MNNNQFLDQNFFKPEPAQLAQPSPPPKKQAKDSESSNYLNDLLLNLSLVDKNDPFQFQRNLGEWSRTSDFCQLSFELATCNRIDPSTRTILSFMFHAIGEIKTAQVTTQPSTKKAKDVTSKTPVNISNYYIRDPMLDDGTLFSPTEEDLRPVCLYLAFQQARLKSSSKIDVMEQITGLCRGIAKQVFRSNSAVPRWHAVPTSLQHFVLNNIVKHIVPSGILSKDQKVSRKSWERYSLDAFREVLKDARRKKVRLHVYSDEFYASTLTGLYSSFNRPLPVEIQKYLSMSTSPSAIDKQKQATVMSTDAPFFDNPIPAIPIYQMEEEVEFTSPLATYAALTPVKYDAQMN